MARRPPGTVSLWGRAALLTQLLLVPAAAAAQTLEVRPDTGRLTVGDPVSLRLVLRQYEGDALLEQVPHPLAALGDGVRLLAVDSMRRVSDRLLEAHARMAFYRPGPQLIPAFAIDFRRGAVILHGTMRSEPVPIEIAAVLTEGGGSTLRDIREPADPPGPDPRLVAALLAAAAGAIWWARHRRDRPLPVAPASAVGPEPPPAAALDPFALALDRLAEIERAGWNGAGDVSRQYAAVTDALRDCLEASAGLPARERTTTEVRWALPPALSRGKLGTRYDAVFGQADMVKFAGRRPGAEEASGFLGAARELVADWHGALADAPAPAPAMAAAGISDGDEADAVR